MASTDSSDTLIIKNDFDTLNELLVNDSNRKESSQKARRSTLISIPPTLINISNQEYLNYILVQPTVFFYKEQSFDEFVYRSIEDIRELEKGECLWIDVNGVREKKFKIWFSLVFYRMICCLFRFTIVIY